MKIFKAQKTHNRVRNDLAERVTSGRNVKLSLLNTLDQQRPCNTVLVGHQLASARFGARNLRVNQVIKNAYQMSHLLLRPSGSCHSLKRILTPSTSTPSLIGWRNKGVAWLSVVFCKVCVVYTARSERAQAIVLVAEQGFAVTDVQLRCTLSARYLRP